MTNNYDGTLKYKQENGDIAVLYPKTKVANVEGAATAASVTAVSGRVNTVDANVTKNTHDIADHGTRPRWQGREVGVVRSQPGGHGNLRDDRLIRHHPDRGDRG